MANFMPKKKKPTEEEEPREKRSCNYKEKGTCIQVQKEARCSGTCSPAGCLESLWGVVQVVNN
jgi:hypothetical protein